MYNQKDLPIRIIGLAAVITLLEGEKKVQAVQTWWKITLVKVTAQSRKGYMAISKQSEAHYSTDRLFKREKKSCFQFSQGRTSQSQERAQLRLHMHQLSLKSWIMTVQLHYLACTA